MTIKNLTPQLKRNCLKLITLSSLLLIASCTDSETLLNSDLESENSSGLSSKSVELPILSTTADEEQSANPASNATDNSSTSRWSGFGDPVNLVLDLGSVNLVDYIKVSFYKGNERTSSFQVLTSNDNSNWTLINTKVSSGTTTSLETFDLSNKETRYVRLKCTGNSLNNWNSILDIQVYGTEGDDTTPTSNYTSIPATIQAEDHDSQSGTQTQPTEDSSGVDNVGWIDSGDYLTYNLNVPNSGTYTVDFRVASPTNPSKFDFYQGNTKLTSVSKEATGNWQNWTTTSKTVNLTSGDHTFKILATGSKWNINWIKFTAGETVDPITTDPPTGDLDPNKAPSQNFDLSQWYLSVPVDNGDGLATSIQVGDLNNGYELENASGKDYFYTDPNNGGMVFRNYPKNAKKTSSSTSYSRTELREMLTGGSGDVSNSTKDAGNNWWFSSSNNIPSGNSDPDDNAGGVDGILTATLKVNRVTQTSDSNTQVGRIIIGQIHASKNEPNRLYYHKQPGHDKGAIYVCHEDFNGNETYYNIIGDYVVESGSKSGDYSGAGSPSDGIGLNEEFSYKIEVVGNDQWVTISRSGKSDITQYIDMSDSDYDSENDYMYFKAGVYSQNKTCQDDSDYDQVTFYALKNTH